MPLMMRDEKLKLPQRRFGVEGGIVRGPYYRWRRRRSWWLARSVVGTSG